MSKKQAFISHIAEDAPLAARLRAALDRDFLGNLDICLLSDGGGAPAGADWLDSVEAALRNSALLIALCRPASVRRPWINFEAGAAWMLAMPIIPVCHAGLRPCDLPFPLSFREGITLGDPDDLRRLYARIAEVLACRVPTRPFTSLARELTAPDVPAGDGASTGPSQLLNDAENGRHRHEAQASLGDGLFSIGRAAEGGHALDPAADAPRAEPRARPRKPKSDVDVHPHPQIG
jgi:hypothetical protein